MCTGVSISDVTTLFEAIEEVYQTFSHQPWWRGHTNESWTLVPGVHRVTGHGAAYEANIAIKFEQRAPTRHMTCPPPGDQARWLFLMQHYRLRTRLLDWTESPLVGLYFAVLNDKHSSEAGALWALDPYRMNELQIGEAVILQPGHDDAKELIGAAFSRSPVQHEKVLALLTHEVDVRMMVQLSALTIHSSPTPMERRPDASDYSHKFVVTSAAKSDLRKHLERLGIRERNLFPDLDHLATDLNRDVY